MADANVTLRDRIMREYPGVSVRVIDDDVIMIYDARGEDDPNVTASNDTYRTAINTSGDTHQTWGGTISRAAAGAVYP